MSRTNRKIPYKLPCFTYSFYEYKCHRDGHSSKQSPDKEYKREHNRLLRKRQKAKLLKGEEFLLNKKSHIWDWW